MPQNPASSASPTPRLDWFLNAHFGLFIHWGAYAVGGVEASWPIMTPDLAEAMFKNPRRISQADYEQLPARFNPTRFNAREWVRIAQNAGMRYIILTSKHHDGFCMFDAPGTDYKITRTPFGRDICLELAEACAAAGMRLGFYYSPPDMHHPGYRDTAKPLTANWLGEPKRPQWATYLDYMESHIRKLLTDYGPVSVIWFDALVNHRKYDPPRFHRLIHSLSPNTLINDRLGAGYDYITPEQFIPKQGVPVRTGKPPAAESGGEGLFRAVPALLNAPLVGNWLKKQLDKYAAGELELTKIPQAPNPSPAEFQPWETCMTMGTTWAFNPQENAWKSPLTLLKNLIETTSRGGNLLLNIGPTPEGVFPPEAVERLAFIARWMEVNAPAIHNTTYAPPIACPNGRFTRAGSKFYLHVLDWPTNGKVVIAGFPAAVTGAAVLGGAELAFSQQDGALELSVPSEPPHPAVTVICIHTEEK